MQFQPFRECFLIHHTPAPGTGAGEEYKEPKGWIQKGKNSFTGRLRLCEFAKFAVTIAEKENQQRLKRISKGFLKRSLKGSIVACLD